MLLTSCYKASARITVFPANLRLFGSVWVMVCQQVFNKSRFTLCLSKRVNIKKYYEQKHTVSESHDPANSPHEKLIINKRSLNLHLIQKCLYNR